MIPMHAEMKFKLDTRESGSWPAGLTVFHCVTPLRTADADVVMLAWCLDQFGPRGDTWGWSDPWLTFTDEAQATAFRMRWT